MWSTPRSFLLRSGDCAGCLLSRMSHPPSSPNLSSLSSVTCPCADSRHSVAPSLLPIPARASVPGWRAAAHLLSPLLIVITGTSMVTSTAYSSPLWRRAEVFCVFLTTTTRQIPIFPSNSREGSGCDTAQMNMPPWKHDPCAAPVCIAPSLPVTLPPSPTRGSDRNALRPGQ